MLNKWKYDNTEAFSYGETESYVKAVAFLDGHGTVEDWGCGTAWAKRLFTQSVYTGIDGSWSKFCDKHVELQTYTSTPDCILMRHVLEHNLGWRAILGNALASFQRRMSLITFTPFGQETRVMGAFSAETVVGSSYENIPDISFNYSDLTETFKDLIVKEETIKTGEHLFYLQK